MALEEFYNTGDDSWISPTSIAWYAMTWTTTSAYNITSVKLKLFRGGTPPANVIVSIRATDGTEPTGGDLTSGSIAGAGLLTTPGQFEEITLTPYALSDATKYAIIVRSDTVSVSWRIDNSSPSYGGGNGLSSADSGGGWTTRTYDMMFEIYSGSTPIELSGTIAASSGVSGNMVVASAIELSGTVAAVSAISGNLGSVLINVRDVITRKRVAAVGSNQFWYEDI